MPLTPSRSVSALLATVGLAALLSPGAAFSNVDQIAYGKHLAQECTTCHRHDGKGEHIPVIFGLQPDYFVSTMKLFKTGARQNPVMNSVAEMLNDEQLDALASYLATQKPTPPAKTAPPAKRK